MLLTGDFCPINRVEELVISQKYDLIFNDFMEVLSGNDLNITDLECPLTLSDRARPKIGPHQKAHPGSILALKHAGFNVVAMANNHIMDYEETGVEETVRLCHQNNIYTIGIGRNAEEAAQPLSLTVKNRRIALLNFAENEFLTGSSGSWTCNGLDPAHLFYSLQEIRETHDYVIVIIHGGNEFYKLPSPRIKKLYRYVIDLGADALISHHTHAFSGYEVYKSKPIFYGLGNFIYDWPGKRNQEWNRGYVVKLLLSDKPDFKIIPLKQGNEKPGLFLLNNEEQETFRNDIEKLNQIIADDSRLEAEFNKYCEFVFPVYDSYIEPAFGRYVTFLRKRGLFPRFMSKRKRLLLLNVIRAESHREVLIRMLEGHLKYIKKIF